jgi:hypothetical protein
MAPVRGAHVPSSQCQLRGVVAMIMEMVVTSWLRKVQSVRRERVTWTA